MKKVYLSFTILLITASAFAQNIVLQEVSHIVARDIDLPTPGIAATDHGDTLGIDEFGNPVLYSSLTGYVFGTSDLEDTQSLPGSVVHQLNYEFAGGFIVNTDYNVIGAMLLFAAKSDASGSPSDVTVNLWSLADNKARSGITAQTPDVIGPDQVLTSVALPFTDVDTVLPTFVTFASPVFIDEDFGIGVDIEALYGAPADSVALVADENGDSDGEYTWTKFGFTVDPPVSVSPAWFLTTGTLQGGLDVNVAIFAIVEEVGVGIEEQGFINGVKMTTYPNPALRSDNVRIDYGLETSKTNVVLNIYSTDGQLVYTSEEGRKSSGTHSIQIPTGTLSAGSYVYSLEANGARIAKRVEVLK